MLIQCKHLSTGDEYTNFVREFVTLLDKQLTAWEALATSKQGLAELVNHMPAIISLVNTVGYLRGQDGVFLGIRPLTESQKEFYGYEDLFEARLDKLIDLLMSSDSKKLYRDKLENYFIIPPQKPRP